MKKIAIFSIPATGHTNPLLPVAAELVRRGHSVRFYSFSQFEEKIRATGAEFWPCDSYLPELTDREEAGLKNVSTTEMTIQDLRITVEMDGFLARQFKRFEPDVVVADSVCFWGKLTAWKYKVPLVVSTSTLAFNQMSAQYMKNSPKEVAGMVIGLPRIAKELKKLESYGYYVRNPLTLVQSDNETDTIVYTSRRFQPYVESFTDHYAFVGPSIFSKAAPDKKKARPLIYISLGTVINDRPSFYLDCICALRDLKVDVLISCGSEANRKKLGKLPENARMEPSVDQLDVLSKADVFITHCGMNSVSESLYMATPMVLYPQTNEQRAVAQRVIEMNAGLMLKDPSIEGIRFTVQEVLGHGSYSKAAEECSEDFRSCPGAPGAAGFIEKAPHKSDGVDILKQVNQTVGIVRMVYWTLAAVGVFYIGAAVSWKYVWLIAIAAVVIYAAGSRALSGALYRHAVKKSEK